MCAQNHSKMDEEEKFIGGLADGAQTDDDEEAERNDCKEPDLNELGVDGSWLQTKK